MLEVQGLRKEYNAFTLDCTLEVKPGYVTGLIGQNGAGKSTTFKALLGLIHADGGQGEILGKDIKSITAKDKQKIGVVLSDSGFSEYLSVQDLVPILKELYEEFDKNDFLKQCERFGLPMKKKLKTFSTGMKVKLKLLVAMSHNASLLILDEPTAGLDVIARNEVLEMLREFMEQGQDRAILISSHIATDLESLCDDFYMIHDGKIVMHKETDVLLSDYAILKVTEEQFQTLEKQYLLRKKKEYYGYDCLTNQKQFFMDNYKDIVVEKSGIDEFLWMMIRGERI